MATVGDILAGKGSLVHRIAPDRTVFEAIQTMVDRNCGALLVMEGDEIAGIITERDYLRRVALEGRTSRETTVRDIMSTPVVYIESSDGIEAAMALMTDRRIRHLPVVDGGALVGLVSIGDLVRYQSREKTFQIKYLEDYISAR